MTQIKQQAKASRQGYACATARKVPPQRGHATTVAQNKPKREEVNKMLTALQSAALPVIMGAADLGFDSKPNQSLPGGDLISKIVGGLQTWGIYAAIFCLVIGACMLGFGNFSHNPAGASKGKMVLLGGVLALILIGGVNAIGQSFYDMGQTIE